MATDRGADVVRRNGKAFARFQWESWSPHGWFDDAVFNAVAESLKNPDWPNSCIPIAFAGARPSRILTTPSWRNDKSPHFRCDPRDPGWFQTTAPTASFPVRQMGVLVSTISI